MIAPDASGRASERLPSLEEALTALVADHGLLGNRWPSLSSVRDDLSEHSPPATLLLDGRHLAALRDEVVGGEANSPLETALQSLANSALAMPVDAVTDKTAAGPSGDLHDYVSLARYWWPDTTTTAGVPYVRRDGQANPDCASEDLDSNRLARFSDSVLALAVCGYVLDEPQLSEGARQRLNIWLVDPRTRQNPHFEFAQLVRGRDWLRPPAVVDARRMLAVAEAFRLLRSQGMLSSAEVDAMSRWFAALLEWLVHSATGTGAVNARNNVAAWCLLERAALADLVGDETRVSLSLAEAGELLAAQVESDGSLPSELARENPADYTAFAFVAMAQLARVGEVRGVPLWERATAQGRGLAATREWLATVASRDAAQVNGPDAVGLAMRLLSWREEALTQVSARADRLGDELGRRDRQIARLTSQLERQREDVGRSGRRLVTTTSSERTSVRGTLGSLRRQAPAWPVIGPVGRGGKRAVRAYRRGRAGAPPPAAAGSIPADLEERLIRDYRASDLASRPPTFVLYRILGNDLPPRHSIGQTLTNLRFILDNEPALEGCEKRWILNRIVDEHTERALLDVLAAHGQPVLRLPFDAHAYRRQSFDTDTFPRPDFLTSDLLDRSDPYLCVNATCAAYRHKNLYAMNNNGARNAAIEDGRARASWVLPFDGSTFFHADAWRELRAAVTERPHVPYVVVPMARVGDNAEALAPSALHPADEEPQIVFRADARERFDEQRPYGRRSKVDLLWRLGVPGRWERWHREPWDLPFPSPSPDHGCFQQAGQVVRLETGTTRRDLPGTIGIKERGAIREGAIVAFLRDLDAACFAQPDPTRLAFYDDDLLEELANGAALPSLAAAIVADAQAALLRGPFAVTDKTTCAPSGNIRDYWHPAPYWWPDPSRPDGLPYRRVDGRRVPGTEMFSPQSGQFDRTRLHLAFSDVTELALAWRITGDTRYAEHAARQLRTWFVNADTAMTPHLRYAQVRRGHDGDRGQASGIIEFKDIYYALDAVRLLQRSQCLTPADIDRFHDWLDKYLDWLLSSEQGTEEQRATNNHGTCYDLQTMSIAMYLGRGQDFTDAALRATGRLRAHFDRFGRQPEELARTQTRHYCAFNLQSWANLARVADSGGCDLWREPDGKVGTLGRGIDWYLAMQADEGWPYPQAHPFDPRRDAVIEATGLLLRQPALSPLAVAEDIVASTASSVMNAHDGVAPFWPLALGPRRRAGERAGRVR